MICTVLQHASDEQKEAVKVRVWKGGEGAMKASQGERGAYETFPLILNKAKYR